MTNMLLANFKSPREEIIGMTVVIILGVLTAIGEVYLVRIIIYPFEIDLKFITYFVIGLFLISIFLISLTLRKNIDTLDGLVKEELAKKEIFDPEDFRSWRSIMRDKSKVNLFNYVFIPMTLIYLFLPGDFFLRRYYFDIITIFLFCHILVLMKNRKLGFTEYFSQVIRQYNRFVDLKDGRIDFEFRSLSRLMVVHSSLVAICLFVLLEFVLLKENRVTLNLVFSFAFYSALITGRVAFDSYKDFYEILTLIDELRAIYLEQTLS